MSEARLLGAAAAIEALVVDLDDTLFPQAAWLDGACDAVAWRAAENGVDPAALRRALSVTLSGGSDTGRVIDEALALAGVGAGVVVVEELVDVFRAYAPARLPTYPGVRDALAMLARRVPIALVSDGAPLCQRSKLVATGVEEYLSVVVLSDELGREHRKPDAAPFLMALRSLGSMPAATVVIGDRPDKDIEGAARAGMRAVRVRTGEHKGRGDHPRTWAVAPDFSGAAGLVEPLLVGASSQAPC
ncbi:MAG: HAD family hydrolase [Acidimicrobiales bacterium]